MTFRLLVTVAVSVAGVGGAASGARAARASDPIADNAPASVPGCLLGGDGYLRAHLAGAINADIDWPNAGTVCEGEVRLAAGDPAASTRAARDGPVAVPAGVRLSFRRSTGAQSNLLFVFGISGAREGEPLHDAGVNLTVMVQHTSHIYSTRSDTRCTADSLTQQRLAGPHSYRLEVRGFCTQPAHAVRGNGDLLVTRFDFAGRVNYQVEDDAQ
jgi:hypothetical protein